MIKNPIYTGKVTWNKKSNRGVRRPKSEWLIVDGKHEAIIEDELYRTAQTILKSRYHAPYHSKLSNQLAGLMICSKCHSKLQQRYPKAKPRQLVCTNNRCNTRSSYTHLIEEKLLQSLAIWLNDYKLSFSLESFQEEKQAIQLKKQTIKNIETELNELTKQQTRLFELLERGIYDENTFKERSLIVNNRLEELTNTKLTLLDELSKYEHLKQSKELLVPVFEKILDLYKETEDIELKNRLLKTVIQKVEYHKEPHQKLDDFTLTIYPKLPKL